MVQNHRREMNRRIQRYFDERAARWDEIMPADVAQAVAALTARLNVRPGQRVLDVGAGTGTLARVLQPRVGAGGRIVSLDLARGMTEMLLRQRPDASVVPVQADAMRPPFAPAAFDWVVCNNCFPHFEDQARAVGALGAVLRPGGRLVVCHTSSREDINAHHCQIGGLVGGHELPDDTTMRGYFTGAGLRVATLENAANHYLAIAERPQ